MISPLAALLRLHELNTEPPEDEAKRRRHEQRLMVALPDRLQAHYETARRRYGLTAVVPLERGICRGCYVRQPSAPKSIEEGVFSCQSCGRVLYDQEAAFEELVG